MPKDASPSMRTRNLADVIGAEILDVDLSIPLDDATFAAIKQAWLARNILLFRNQEALTPQAQIAFSRRFGELEYHTLPQYTHPDFPEIFVVSNVVVEGKNVGAPRSGRNWHSDAQYRKEPSAASFLVAKEVPPEKGDTMFANMYAAYDALSAAMKKQIEGRKVLISRINAYPISYPSRPPLTDEERARVPDVVHPLVRTHPETGRKALYVGGDVAWDIVGMPHDEGRALIKELRDFATQPRFVYSHHWRVGDGILWDNRCSMHCATPFDEDRYRRHMYRTTIRGTVPF